MAVNACRVAVGYSHENSPSSDMCQTLGPTHPLAVYSLAFMGLAPRLTEAKSCSHFLLLHFNMPRTVLGIQTLTNNIGKWTLLKKINK